MDNPFFIDFEASSLSLLDSYPIEVGICLPDGEVKSWLIQPHILWSDWSAESETIHGISRASLEEEGTHFKEVAKNLNQLLDGQQVYCDALSHDIFWLHRLYKASQLKPSFELESIACLLNDKEKAAWQPTRKKLIKQLNWRTHRAGEDALMLFKTWQAIKEKH